MTSNFHDVGQFHTKFELPVSTGTPKHPTRELLEFRIKFLLEEIFEFIEAAGYTPYMDDRPFCADNIWLSRSSSTVDHAKMFDALIDEVYVAMGTAHLLGYPWQQGWDLVQQANMAKVRAKADGSDSLRQSSFDVVKPEGWEAPDIAGLLQECGWVI